MAQVANPLEFARKDLLPYAIAQMPRYKVAPHHRQVARALEDVEQGKIKRLMIFMPPRFGKSQLSSAFFPAWYLGRNPTKQIIMATYAQELADDWGRRVRDQMRDTLHKQIFPACNLRTDSAAVSRLNTVEGGNYYAVGVGGAITGRGADVFLIDDPVKGREEAESEIVRRRVRDWYQSVAYTRLMPNAAIVVVMTRWEEDDLAGWLLKEHKHENWHVISLPAIGADGTALWPEAYPLEALYNIQRTLGPREWSALYQQDPTPYTGGFFEAKDFKFYDILPAELKIYGTSDYAVTADAGDYTELGVWGIDKDRNVYALDWWRGQTGADTWINAQIDLIALHYPLAWFGESGAIKRAIEPFLNKALTDRGVYCNMQWIPSINSKEIRLRGFQAMAKMGKVYFPRKRWVDDVLSQLLKFPAGKYDDAVDACGLLARALESITTPYVQSFGGKVITEYDPYSAERMAL